MAESAECSLLIRARSIAVVHLSMVNGVMEMLYMLIDIAIWYISLEVNQFFALPLTSWWKSVMHSFWCEWITAPRHMCKWERIIWMMGLENISVCFHMESKYRHLITVHVLFICPKSIRIASLTFLHTHLFSNIEQISKWIAAHAWKLECIFYLLCEQLERCLASYYSH